MSQAADARDALEGGEGWEQGWPSQKQPLVPLPVSQEALLTLRLFRVTPSVQNSFGTTATL